MLQLKFKSANFSIYRVYYPLSKEINFMKIYSIQSYNFCPKLLSNNKKNPSLTFEGRTGTQSDVAIMANQALASKGFFSKEKDDFTIKDISPKEYLDKKTEILIKGMEFPTFELVSQSKINKWNAQLLEYMLRHPEEFKDKHDDIIYSIAGDMCKNHPTTQNEAEIVLHALKNPWILNNEAISFELTQIAHNVKNSEKYGKVKMKMFDLLERNSPKLNEIQSLNMSTILKSIYSPEGYMVARKLIDNPRLIPSKTYLEDGKLLKCNRLLDADNIIDILKKINSKPKLFDKQYFDEALAAILNSPVYSETDKEVVLKLLDNPDLFNNRDFVNEFCGRRLFPSQKYPMTKLLEHAEKGYYNPPEEDPAATFSF